ncbi:Uncharacterised protein [Vibrio cholerae]|nr:Uncharacterised protein [Vibrio cholerae]
MHSKATVPEASITASAAVITLRAVSSTSTKFSSGATCCQACSNCARRLAFTKATTKPRSG